MRLIDADELIEHVMKKSEMNTKLKPCPFCGSKVEMMRIPLWNGSHGYKDCYDFKVTCKKCGCTLNYAKTDTIYRTEEEAINNVLNAWNERKMESEGINMLKTIWDDVDRQEIAKSVLLLDLFTKTYCRYLNDYERFDDLKFRCEECPFRKENGACLVKSFKNKYAPDYQDFGSMGDL